MRRADRLLDLEARLRPNRSHALTTSRRRWKRRYGQSTAILLRCRPMGAHSRDGDQRFQAMVITDSSDRDHAQGGAEH